VSLQLLTRCGIEIENKSHLAITCIRHCVHSGFSIARYRKTVKYSRTITSNRITNPKRTRDNGLYLQRVRSVITAQWQLEWQCGATFHRSFSHRRAFPAVMMSQINGTFERRLAGYAAPPRASFEADCRHYGHNFDLSGAAAGAHQPITKETFNANKGLSHWEPLGTWEYGGSETIYT
jgi:hypothetical protein